MGRPLPRVPPKITGFISGGVLQCWASGAQIRIWGVGQTDTWILGRYLGSIWVSVYNLYEEFSGINTLLLHLI